MTDYNKFKLNMALSVFFILSTIYAFYIKVEFIYWISLFVSSVYYIKAEDIAEKIFE